MNPRRSTRMQVTVPERPYGPQRQTPQEVPVEVPTVAVNEQPDEDVVPAKKSNPLHSSLYDVPYLAFRSLCFHPINVTTALIQMGYEPFYVRRERNVVGRQSFLLLNRIAYINYIRKVDGFFGCFRGYIPFTLYHILFPVVNVKVSKTLKSWILNETKVTAAANLWAAFLTGVVQNIEETGARDAGFQVQLEEVTRPEGEGQDNRNAIDVTPQENDVVLNSREYTIIRSKVYRILLKNACAQMAIEVVSVGAALIILYPLKTVSYIAISEFVGRDGIMSRGFVFGIRYLYDTRGISGFYGGLVPCLLGESIKICLLGVLEFTFSTHLRALPSLLNAGLNFSLTMLTLWVTYPFQVVSTTMAVSRSGFRFSCPPFMAPVANWRECWNHLASLNMLSRGFGMFFRYYTGPVDASGEMIPVVGANIGPDIRQA